LEYRKPLISGAFFFVRPGNNWQAQAEAERDAVLAGVRYAQLPHYLVAAALDSGRLVEVLGEFAPPAWDVFVYRPQRGPVPPRIRRVFDAIVEAMSDAAPART
jgi:DNA-binding transcriptional LysR family regulator